MTASCQVCKKQADFVCGNCNQTYYCSEDCQLKDTINHREICEEYEICLQCKKKFKKTTKFRSAFCSVFCKSEYDVSKMSTNHLLKLLKRKRSALLQIRPRPKHVVITFDPDAGGPKWPVFYRDSHDNLVCYDRYSY